MKKKKEFVVAHSFDELLKMLAIDPKDIGVKNIVGKRVKRKG